MENKRNSQSPILIIEEAGKLPNEQLKKFLDIIPQIIWVSSPDGEPLYFNQRWYDFGGVTQEDFHPLLWSEMIHPDDIAGVREIRGHGLRQGVAYEQELRMRHSSGEYRWLLVKVEPYKDSTGVVLQWVGTATEVQKQKKLQSHLELYSLLCNCSTDFIAITTTDGQFIYMNESARNMAGVGEVDLDSLALKDILFPEEQEFAKQVILPGLISEGRWSGEVRLKNVSTNCPLYLHSTIFNITNPDNEGVKAVATVSRDLSSQRHKEWQLNEMTKVAVNLNSRIKLEEKFQMLGEKTRDIIGSHLCSIWVDHELCANKCDFFIFSSGKYENRDYLPRPEIKNVLSLFDDGKPLRFTKEELKTNTLWSETSGVQFKHHSLVGVMVVPLVQSDGNIMGFIQLSDKMKDEFTPEDEDIVLQLAHAIAIAIENEDLLTREIKAVKGRDDFLSVASHELKTPLTSLMLESQLMSLMIDQDVGKFDVENLKKFLEQINTQTSKLATFVNTLLDLSRIRSGQLKLQPEQCNLLEIVKDVLHLLKPQFDKADGEFPKIVKSCEVSGFWDRIRIEQVITNILTNALKYGEMKPIEIHIEKIHGMARLTVIDQGRGISAEDTEMIFNRFETGSLDRQGADGMGLGLFISSEIILAHKGRIWAESVEGDGSSFFVELPLHPERVNNE